MTTIGFLPLYGREGASSRYRVYQFLEPLASRGHRCLLVEAPERRLGKRLGYLPRLAAVARRCDVLFVQKRMFPRPVLRLMRRANPRIVFDLDDATYLRSAQRQRVDDLLSASSSVIVGNRHLAAYARRFSREVTILPTVVDTRLYRPAEERSRPLEPVVLGWIGGDPNRGDLAGLAPVLDALADRYDRRLLLRTVGSRPLERKTKLRLESRAWGLESARAELREFDIGIMPLADTAWNRGKCGFKLIQYMAAGAPAVASPVGVNREIVEDGVTGFLAGSEEEWLARLSALIEDPPLRRRMGEKGRERVVRHYSVRAVLPKLLGIIDQVAHRPPGRGRSY